MGIRRSISATLASLCALTGGLLLGGASAHAAVIHHYLSHITEIPAHGPHGEPVPVSRQLGRVSTMTVDGGRLFVGEQKEGAEGTFTLDEFGASSLEFERQLTHASREEFDPTYGLAVGHATGASVLYAGSVNLHYGEHRQDLVDVLGESGKLLDEWKGAGTPSKEFGSMSSGSPGVGGVAVDNSTSLSDWAAGDVYVTNNDNLVAPTVHAVQVFRPEAAGEEVKEGYVTQITGPSPTESFGELSSVAVDQANGEVIVAERSAVYVFKPTILGEYEFVRRIASGPGGPFGYVQGVAVDGGAGSESGDIYVIQSASEVDSGEIDQYDSEGVYVGRLVGTPAGAFHLTQSVAVDPASGDVYVGDLAPEGVGAVDVFGPGLVIPDVVNESASSVTPRSATLNGTVNPDAAGEATCQFDFGTTSSLGEVAACPGPVANGESPVQVHNEISGLQADTTYHYRLEASNGNGTDLGTTIGEFTTLGPGIHEESVSDVAPTSATLNATIDPHGKPTSYYFQYGPSSEYGTDMPAPPGTAIGSGEGDVEVTSQHLQGLHEGTVYHYRVVALGEVEVEPGVFQTEEFLGADQTFTTQSTAAFALPDGRQWEMVSPPDKHGALLEGINNQMFSTDKASSVQAAAGGEAFAFPAATPTEAQPAGYSNTAQVLAVRGAQGWTSKDVSLAHPAATGASFSLGDEYRVFSADLSLAIVQPFGQFIPASSPLALAPGEASEQTAFLRSDYASASDREICSGSCYRPLVSGLAGHANVPPGTVFGGETRGECTTFICGPRFAGGTPDLSHVVLESGVALTQTTPSATEGGLYEWSAGALTLVSVLPDGEPADAPVLGSGIVMRHAISDDGSLVAWQTTRGTGHLYVRDLARKETAQLDVVASGSGTGAALPQFEDAASDGSKVFFKDSQRLTEGSGEGDLYECEMVIDPTKGLQCKLTDLTPAVLSGQGAGEIPSAENADPGGGMVGTGADGSYVYFTAGGVLAPGAVHGECGNQYDAPGDTCNLYVRHDGTTTLVAILSGDDFAVWAGEGWGTFGAETQIARVSPDGQWLAFASDRELVPGVSTRDAVSGQPDEQVYLYHATTGQLVCASCAPSGARPVGVEARSIGAGFIGADLEWRGRQWLAATIPTWTPYATERSVYQSRYLSDSGRLFFNSHDALVPQDVNGTWDVYEYEPFGVGGCASGAPNSDASGCVGLISAGTSDQESAFLDASESGGDVFFVTKSKLAPQDYDNAFDVYDAHECSAAAPCFAAAPLAPPPCVTGDACKPAPTPQPAIFGVPSSATFSGAGNIVPSGQGPPVVRPRKLTRAQRLAAALRACEHRRAGRRRAACRTRARRRLGAGGRAKRSRGGSTKGSK